MTPVRVAAVGTGRWSSTLAEAAGRGTGLTIVACTSRSAANRAAFAKTHGCRDLPSLEAVLADPEVEGVLITTPHSLHAEQVVAAAGATKVRSDASPRSRATSRRTSASRSSRTCGAPTARRPRAGP